MATATTSDVQPAIAAAVEAQAAWRALPAPERGATLQRAADLLDERREAAAQTLTEDMGKAIRDARAEVARSSAIFRWFAAEALQPAGEVYPSADPELLLMTREVPLGVVAAITPWNFPFAIPAWKLAPALVFGNAVVWKPAELASGSAMFIADVLSDAGLAPGVLSILRGRGSAIGPVICADERIAAITFTGSNATGMALKQAVASRGIRVQLELGGKNAAVIAADADLGHAADQIVRGAMLSTGQRCTATSRVYVESPVFDEAIRAILDRVAALRVGDPFEEDTDVGPLASDEQATTVGRYLELARSSCTVLCGGGFGPGRFAEPTVLTDVPAESPLLREEIFGPVLVVERANGLDDAIARLNDSEFGLSSAIFTSSLQTALAFADRAETGLVHVNRETAGVEPHVPFGGMKGSSNLEREQGRAARRFFTVTKTIYVRPR
jgi:aldehyde dehydrogenase (NAD+)